MVQNNCSPSSIFGTFSQTLFLGVSVRSFDAQVGFNGQTCECTIQLVEDPCTAPTDRPKVYWDNTLTQQTTTAADPGFLGHTIGLIGRPAYFRIAEFEFAGIIQSWEQTNSSDAYPTYVVKLIDPTLLLDGIQLIIGDYSGGVGSGYNIFNVFGYAESLGNSCPQISLTSLPAYSSNYSGADQNPDGAIFGTTAGGFGGSERNNNGMQWTRIAQIFNIQANSIPITTNIWNPYGRVLYKGPSSDPGYGLLGSDTVGNLCEYFIDLSEMPTMPTYWRLSGSTISVAEAIAQVTQSAGYDYYIELIPVVTPLSASGITKFIKLRTVYRGTDPGLGQIDSFINNAPNVISSTNGLELRNEPVSSLIIGGQKETIYQAERRNDDDNFIMPFFGLDDDGNVIEPQLDANDEWVFTIETTRLANHMKVLNLPATFDILEVELLCAEGGFDEWLSYESIMKQIGAQTDIGVVLDQVLDLKGLFTLEKLIELFNGGREAELLPRDIRLPHKPKFFNLVVANAGQNVIEAQEDIQTIFEWLQNIANEYYGKKFQIQVPYVCGITDAESGQIFLSESPSNKGWTEQTSVIRLPTSGADMLFFRDANNQITAFARIDQPDATNILDTTQLSENDYIVYNTGLSAVPSVFIRAQVDEGYVYSNKDTLFEPRVVFTIPGVRTVEQFPKHIIGLKRLVDIFARDQGINALDDPDGGPQLNVQDWCGKIMSHATGKGLFFGIGTRYIVPKAAAVGILSHVSTYGPWVAYTSTKPGRTVIEQDAGLVPWEFDGYSALNTAGNAIATIGLTNMSVGERGSITVASYPTIPLGCELGAMAGGFFGAGSNLVDNRVHSTGNFTESGASGTLTIGYGYFTYSGTWTGLYGPNVTGITTTISPQGIQTTYTMSTFTPKFGRWAKYNVDRMKNVPRLIQNSIKNLRIRENIELLQGRNRFELNAGINRLKAGFKNLGDIVDKRTPHEALVGQMHDWLANTEDFRRTVVGTEHLDDVNTELQYYYSKKAIMSLDGLIRPVSMDRSGGLPGYAHPTGAGSMTQSMSRGSIPPIGSGGDTFYDDAIHIDYLNPLTNPSPLNRSDLVSDKSGDDSVGHDIDIVARGETPPTNGLGMAYSANPDTNDYRGDYRFMALRGPLMMHGWGYDLDGRPIPNDADTEDNASNGEFRNSGLTNMFMDGFLRKPHTWPVAPVDLRYDRERAVWTIPQPQLIYGTLATGVENLGDPAQLNISGLSSIYDDNGVLISSPTISVINKASCSPLPSGCEVIASYQPGRNEYWIIEANRCCKNYHRSYQLDQAQSVTSSWETVIINTIDVPYNDLVTLNTTTGVYTFHRNTTIEITYKIHWVADNTTGSLAHVPVKARLLYDGSPVLGSLTCAALTQSAAEAGDDMAETRTYTDRLDVEIDKQLKLQTINIPGAGNPTVLYISPFIFSTNPERVTYLTIREVC